MIYLLGFAVLIASYTLLSLIIGAHIKKRYCEELLSEPSNFTASLPSRLGLASLPSSRIFRSLSLPIPDKDGEEIHFGTVMVTRAGIFIVCVINGGGILENDPSGKWKHIYGGTCREYENPFRMQQGARELFSYYAEKAGLDGVAAHTVIVYTDPSLRLTHQRPRGLITASELPTLLSRLEKRGRLTLRETRAACAMLKNAYSY
jgi:hypothetical protein